MPGIRRIYAGIFLGAIFCHNAAFGQARVSLFASTIVDKVQAEKRKGGNGSTAIDPSGNATIYILQLLPAGDFEQLGTLLAEYEESRVDKQVGGTDANSGATSVVMKGSVPSVLGIAVENGALKQSVSGTSVTFRGNPVGILNALRAKGYLESFVIKDPVPRELRKFSFSVSFDASRGSEASASGGDGGSAAAANMPLVLRGDAKQLSQFSVRYDIANQRDPRHWRYQEDFRNLVAVQGGELNGVIARSLQALLAIRSFAGIAGLTGVESYWDWAASAQAQIAATPPDGVEAKVKDLLADFAAHFGAEGRQRIRKQLEDKIAQLENNASRTAEENRLLERLRADVGRLERFETEIRSFSDAYKDYLTRRRDIFEKIKKGSILAAEYVNNRPVTGPSQSNFRVIWESDFSKAWEFTFNGSFTFYDSPLMEKNASRIRDFQFAAQLDRPLGQVQKIGNLVLSLAGKYERLAETAMLPAAMMAAGGGAGMMGFKPPKGDIVLGQAKLTIPVKGSGAKIPISLTVANRNEVIKEREVRGNIGLTFDLDTLFAKSVR